MATTKLGLYNGALRLLNEPPIASLSEGVMKRRALDDVYDDALVYCLEQGLWNFATATVEIGSNPSVTPAFGYSYAFDKPTEWVRTVAVSADETFADPLLRVTDEQGYWHADVDPIYVRYVSKDSELGLDLTRWPMTYAKAVETWLAHEVCLPITKSETKLDTIHKLWRQRIADARSKDAMNESARFPPVGTWVRSRSCGSTRGRRRGGLEQ